MKKNGARMKDQCSALRTRTNARKRRRTTEYLKAETGSPSMENLMIHSSSDNKCHERGNGTDNIDVEDVELTPHTMRLLKLIEEGSTEHAELAATQLSATTASSSPLVLWDILGRLQGFLVSPNWKTRHNASVAMVGVAQRLPETDQREFVSRNATSYRSSKANESTLSEQQHTWLKLDSTFRDQILSVVLDKGRTLLSSAGTKYDQEEEVILLHLDSTSSAPSNLSSEKAQGVTFVQKRAELQRRILARRLGFSLIVSQLSGQELEAEILSDKSVGYAEPASAPSNSMTTVAKEQSGDRTKKSPERSIRSLLIAEIQRQQQPTEKDLQPVKRHFDRKISHQNAQMLLANELVFRMFDATWYVRHGSLMGILALMKAWQRHLRPANSNKSLSSHNHAFGIWPQDIMARCLCILALDQFADYSETSTSADSGGVVAPVREMAGQVLAVLYRVAPDCVQVVTCEILEILAQKDAQSVLNKGRESNERGTDSNWEIRHGALIACRYIAAIKENRPRQFGGIIDTRLITFRNWILEMASNCLNDESDDVRGVAAQLLGRLIDGDSASTGYQKQALLLTVGPLWRALETSQLISSSIKDLMSLFSFLVDIDFSRVVELLPNVAKNGLPFEQSIPKSCQCARIFPQLKRLAMCPYTSVKISVIKVVGNVANQLHAYISDSVATLSEELRKDVRVEVANSFCETIEAIFDLYFSHSLLIERDENIDEYELFMKVCGETWSSLSRVSNHVLNETGNRRSELEIYMILSFFNLQTEDQKEFSLASLKHCDCNWTTASVGKIHKSRLDISNAIAVFLVGGGVKKQLMSHSILEMCLRVCLFSPLSMHYESACLLYMALACQQGYSPIDSVLDSCQCHISKVALGLPRCSSFDHEQSLDSIYSLYKTLSTAFKIGIEFVKKDAINLEGAIQTVVALWEKAASKHLGQTQQTTLNANSMRLSVLATGAMLSVGNGCLPTKLTPIVRPLMTSLKNETDQKLRSSTCGHLSKLLIMLSEENAPSTRIQGFRKTQSKILQNLCTMIKRNNEPSCSAARLVISSMLRDMPFTRSVQSIESLWDCMLHLLSTTKDSQRMFREHLHVLEAVCSGIGRRHKDTTLIIQTFLAALVSQYCGSSDQQIRESISKCTQLLCSADEKLTLEAVLPPLASILSEDIDVVRVRASQLLLVVVEGEKSSILPFVRSLLPLAMSLMTDAAEECSKNAANLFAKLVQLAPLVKNSYSVPLMQNPSGGNSELVIDHLIHGKPLPPCQIHPEILMSLHDAGVKLRGYQFEGISWLRFLQTVRLNGALTDSMGLGKTLQALVGIAISHMDTTIGEKPRSIVICPSSVVGHWIQEVKKFFPKNDILKPFCMTRSQEGWKEAGEKLLDDYDLIVMSYATLRAEGKNLCNVKWRYCVLDEGHLLKNPKTATAQAARRLRSRHKLILTGTPVQNKVHEIWAIFDFLMPNFLGSSNDFAMEFAKPITKSQRDAASASDIAAGIEKLKVLHQQVLPFILRREKDQVLKELPPKSISIVPCEMSSIQSELYNRFCSGKVAKKSIDALHGAIEKQRTSKEKDLPLLGRDILKTLLYLRLLCTHPALVHGEGLASVEDNNYQKLDDSGKLIALKQILNESGISSPDLAAADNDISLLYLCAEEADNDDKDDISEALDPDDTSADARSVPPGMTSSSKKSKCLIFAQFTHSLDIVENMVLRQHFPGTKYLRLDGRIPPEERSAIAQTFNTDTSIRILLLTTKIGGLGLNLTGADTVVFLEHDWNPHADLQAMDRAHRIGQERSVNVYKLVTTNSIEERIMQLQETKLAMSNAIVNAENSTMYSMGTDRLLDIFRFRSETSEFKDNGTEEALDMLVERYEEEYSSLSLHGFIEAFRGPAKS